MSKICSKCHLVHSKCSQQQISKKINRCSTSNTRGIWDISSSSLRISNFWISRWNLLNSRCLNPSSLNSINHKLKPQSSSSLHQLNKLLNRLHHRLARKQTHRLSCKKLKRPHSHQSYTTLLRSKSHSKSLTTRPRIELTLQVFCTKVVLSRHPLQSSPIPLGMFCRDLVRVMVLTNKSKVKQLGWRASKTRVQAARLTKLLRTSLKSSRKETWMLSCRKEISSGLI